MELRSNYSICDSSTLLPFLYFLHSFPSRIFPLPFCKPVNERFFLIKKIKPPPGTSLSGGGGVSAPIPVTKAKQFPLSRILWALASLLIAASPAFASPSIALLQIMSLNRSIVIARRQIVELFLLCFHVTRNIPQRLSTASEALHLWTFLQSVLVLKYNFSSSNVLKKKRERQCKKKKKQDF